MSDTDKETYPGNPASEEENDNLLASSEDTPFTLFDADELKVEEEEIDEELVVPKKPKVCEEDALSEPKKDEESVQSEESDQDLEVLFSLEEKCLGELRTAKEVSPDLIEQFDSVFKQYRLAVSEKKKRRIGEDEKIWWKLEDAEINEETVPTEGTCKVKRKTKKFEAPKELTDAERLEILTNENLKLADDNEMLLQRIQDLEVDVNKTQFGNDAEMHEKNISSYIKQVGKLKRELDLMEEKIAQCQEDNRGLGDKLKNKEAECHELEEMVNKYKDDALKHESRRKTVEADVEKANTVMDQLKTSFGRQQEKFLKTVKRLSLKDEENEELKEVVKGFNNQQRCMSKYIVELRDRLEFLSKAYVQVEGDMSRLKDMSRHQTETLQVMKKKSTALENLEEKWIARLQLMNKKIKAYEEKVKKYQEMVQLKTKEINKSENQNIGLNKKINELVREKDEISNKVIRLTELLNEKERRVHHIQKENNTLNFENSNLVKTIDKQKKEIDTLSLEKNTIQQSVKSVKNENELMSVALQSTVKNLLNAEKVVEKKEKEIRDVVADYNNLLLEKKELRSRFLKVHGLSKVYEFKIRFLDSVIASDQHKLDANDDHISKLQYRVQKLQFDYHCLKVAFNERKLEIRKLIEVINSKEKEKGNLDRMIEKGESIRIKVIKDAERLREDVSILKTVIQRRNAEISLVYEKTELMGTILNSGENEMKQRLADILLLKTEVLKLRAENKMLIKTVENNANLKKEINSLRKDLSQAQQKCWALEEQMENPINIHRWRILKGKDPEKCELIFENKAIRKKLLAAENSNVILKEKFRTLEATHTNLIEKLKKTAKEKDCEQELLKVKRIIRHKDSEIQRLSVTVRSYQYNMSELKKEMEEKISKANDCMQKYYDLKRIHDRKELNLTDDELLKNQPFAKKCLAALTENIQNQVYEKPKKDYSFLQVGIEKAPKK